MNAANPFTPAKKEKIYLRMALVGTSGSGKTYTALRIASQLAALCDGKIAFIDTEGRSARKYADKFTFDVLDLSKNYSPTEYINAINAAVAHGYAVIVVDSFTHAWNGAGGVLEIADRAGQKMGGNKFAGWATARPAQNSLADNILTAPIHIIGTMRSKTEWLIQPDPKTGKDKPVKVGLAPVQSEDFEYEFDVVAYMDMQHTMSITKTRCSELDGLENSPDTEFVSGTLYGWLTDGDMPVPASKLAKTMLNTEEGAADFKTFCGALNIKNKADSAPYLAELGCKTGFSEYTGAYEDMKQDMQALYDAMNPPVVVEDEPEVTESETVTEVDPVAEAAEQITDAKKSLNHQPGSSTRAIKVPVAPVTIEEARELVAAADPTPAQDNSDIPATAMNPNYRVAQPAP